jgi:hypothetical protein
MNRLITILVIGCLLFLLGYFGKDAAVDDPSLAQTESISSVDPDAEASPTAIDLQDLEAMPVAALAAKLDARVTAKEAIQLVLNQREDLTIGDEFTIEGLRIKITRVPRKDPVITGRYVVVSDERGSP